jgi:transcription antitermination protein NusB
LGQRRRAREWALQMLFQIDLTAVAPGEVFREFWLGQEASEETRHFAERLVEGVVRERLELDRVLVGSTENWRLERMAVVDRNVLRLGAYELLFESETPLAVVLDEAIEVAKKFGSEESGAFINGVLDAVRRRIERGEIPTARGVTGRG